jgi:hypothetical protein
VTAIGEDALTLRTDGTTFSKVPLDSILTTEVSAGRRRHVRLGAAIGGALGLIAGAAFPVDATLCNDNSRYSCSRGGALTGGVLAYGLMGAGIGALIKTDRWARVNVRSAIAQGKAEPPPAPATRFPLPPPAPPPAVPAPAPSCPNPGVGGAGTIPYGARVRVRALATSGKAVVDTLLASDETTLKLDRIGYLPRESVTRLERLQHSSKRQLGAAIGAGVGFATGAGLAIALIANDEHRTGSGSCDQCGLGVLILGGLGALPGAGVGYVVAPGDRWSDENPKNVCVRPWTSRALRDPRRVNLGIAPARGGGAAFRLSVSF